MTNGITLRADYGPYIVTAISPTQHFYTDTGLSSAVTLPATITTTTTWYCAPAYSDFYTFTCTQLDGTDISPGVPQWVGTTADSTLNPRPSLGQLAADVNLGAGYMKTGFYYITSRGAGITTTTQTINYLVLTAWLVPNTITVSKIGIDVTSAGTSGSVFRMGVYADDGTGYPGALIQEAAATIDGTSATVQEVDFTPNLTLTPGLYWVGGVSQTATMVTRAWNLPTMPIPMRIGTAIGAGSYCTAFVQTGVTGALPATFTSTVTAGTAATRIHVKV